MGFFASIELMWYVFVIVGILLGLRAVVAIISTIWFARSVNQARSRIIRPDGATGIKWTLD